MVNYKLVYFQSRGRAEAIRYIFLHAGEPYDNHHVTEEQFSEIKSTLPFGQVPVLYVDGKCLAQSVTIAKFLAGRFNLTGADDWERAMCNSLVYGIQDVGELFTQHNYFWIKFDGDDAKAAEIYKNIRANNIIPMLDRYEKFLKDNGGQWFVGNSITWADLWIAEFLDHKMDCLVDPKLLDNHPLMKDHCARVHAISAIKEHCAKREHWIF
uniref:glutathione transferase n=1 Tax=Plectus sambesii TaxID=2011161 RepID=A0A914WWX8_9BILA